MASQKRSNALVLLQSREQIVSGEPPELVRSAAAIVLGRIGDSDEITDSEAGSRVYVERCPLCGCGHVHGGFGIRAVHCEDSAAGTYLVLPPAGFVYFAGLESPFSIKIGFATIPAARLKEAQTWSPEKIVFFAVKPADSQNLEKQLHKKFFRHRVRGEWFSAASEIKTEIQSVRKSCFQPFYVSTNLLGGEND